MMNLQETVFSIFPGCTLSGSVSDEGVYEVSGITGAMVLQTCEVLASGVFQYSASERSRRTYLVRANEHVRMVWLLPDESNHLHVQIMEQVQSEVIGAKRLH
jgi:hypothetical protein